MDAQMDFWLAPGHCPILDSDVGYATQLNGVWAGLPAQISRCVHFAFHTAPVRRRDHIILDKLNWKKFLLNFKSYFNYPESLRDLSCNI